MSTIRGPKARLVRRLGLNLFGVPKYDKIMIKKGYAPGMHGRTKFSKLSEYGKQMQEKQRARFMFNISEKQFSSYYAKAAKMDGVTGEQLLRLLERRLDNVIFRSGLAVTRYQARQMASHGLFKVNGRRVDVPSLQVNIGDKIEVREHSKKSTMFARNLETNAKFSAPHWLTCDLKNLVVEIKRLPERDELEQSINSQLIVEFYSK